ncbi:cyclin-like protein [Fimicolochytrium jonesii]|uniref:cyclin-like protein n=1 Tax=Fimicolochytrium jonesii TaxID=1396493 RepID=UPI0022FF0A89|nr:cyclin-like protein [Fimicolochytrium jonesii]KAI8818662.1 cyclin-like protein [Fimicolochytrium jonesii]
MQYQTRSRAAAATKVSAPVDQDENCAPRAAVQGNAVQPARALKSKGSDIPIDLKAGTRKKVIAQPAKVVALTRQASNAKEVKVLGVTVEAASIEGPADRVQPTKAAVETIKKRALAPAGTSVKLTDVKQPIRRTISQPAVAAKNLFKENDAKASAKVSAKRSHSAPEAPTAVKKRKVNTGVPAPAPPAKDEGWEDLDETERSDPMMVTEYANDIFGYLRRLEYMQARTIPNPTYLNSEGRRDIRVRDYAADMLIETQNKLHLTAETLFLAMNIIDRVLSVTQVTFSKLPLLVPAALLIASKFEEVGAPSISKFVFVTGDSIITEGALVSAERHVLRFLNYDLSYSGPMNFLRRISKADAYDIQTRTVAKYFMEVSLADHRFVRMKPSLVAAASLWFARMSFQQKGWDSTFVHYSGYTKEEFEEWRALMVSYLQAAVDNGFDNRPLERKYHSKRYLRVSQHVLDWYHGCTSR